MLMLSDSDSDSSKCKGRASVVRLVSKTQNI
jgi:hypothetical protein